MPSKCEIPRIGGMSRNQLGGWLHDALTPPDPPAQILFAADKFCPELVTVAAPAFDEVLMIHEAGLVAFSRYYDGQRYQLIGFEPHTKRDGEETVLACWASNCAECGQPFSLATVARATKFSPSRRCQRCKQPGVRVKKGPRHGRL